jgi:serine/threonine-protein kinase RsbW
VSPDPQSWERTFPNSLPALMRTIESMSDFLNRQSCGPQALYQAQLAAEEIGTNIIKYGYDDQLEHRITLRLECLADCLRLQILDDGHPFDARQVPEPDLEQSLEDRQPGGLGISLVRRLARRMDYERRNGMNTLTVEIPR